MSRRITANAPNNTEATKPSAETVAGIVGEAVPQIVAGLPAGSVVTGAGVAVPGLVRVADGLVRLAPHLGWHDVPLAAMLEDVLGVPVGAANEASLGASAEWVFGVRSQSRPG